jgi:hypothetical protein
MPLATIIAKTPLSSEHRIFVTLIASDSGAGQLPAGHIAKVGFSTKPGFGKWPWLCALRAFPPAWRFLDVEFGGNRHDVAVCSPMQRSPFFRGEAYLSIERP